MDIRPDSPLPSGTSGDNPTPSQASSSSLEQLSEQVKELGEVVREREISLFRAIKTLAADYAAHRRGERDFPQAALLGVIFAYMRPRIVVTIGAIVAVILSGVQLYVILKQNEILRLQTRASEIDAVSGMMSMLSESDSVRNEIAVAQLAEYGYAGFDALIRLAATETGVSFVARKAILGGVNNYDPQQASQVLGLMGPWLFEDPTATTEGQRYITQISETMIESREFRNRIYMELEGESTRDFESILGGVSYLMANSWLNHGTTKERGLGIVFCDALNGAGSIGRGPEESDLGPIGRPDTANRLNEAYEELELAINSESLRTRLDTLSYANSFFERFIDHECFNRSPNTTS